MEAAIRLGGECKRDRERVDISLSSLRKGDCSRTRAIQKDMKYVEARIGFYP